MSKEKINNFISNYKDFKKIFNLLGDKFLQNTNTQFAAIEEGNCDEKTMDYALTLSEYIKTFKKIETSFFDASKNTIEEESFLKDGDEKDLLEYIGLSSLVDSKRSGYGKGLYLNKQHGILGGVISGLVLAFFKENKSSDIIIWSVRASLVIATYFIPSPTFFFIGFDAYLLLILYGLGFVFLAGDKTDEAIAFSNQAENSEQDTFAEVEELHPLVKEKLNVFMSSMDAVTIENYQEAKTHLKDLADTLSKYKKKIQNPAMLSTVVNTDKFIERLDKNEVVFAQEAVDSIKLILDLWDKAKIDNDPDFSMMENISAEMNHLSQDPVYEALSEGYKASLLKEGMMKSFREYVDEADAPDVAKAFKEAIKLENWDLAGINYGYLYALTQKRRRAEEQARQEAQMEAMKSLAKTTAKVTGEAAKGVGKASVGVAKGAAVAGAAAYAANKVAKSKATWKGTCGNCNHFEERPKEHSLKPPRKCPRCGQGRMQWKE
tara:strand:- start:53 stop:1525 length:1473 start_codon:yes stop_codon:yes gene_type:complete